MNTILQELLYRFNGDFFIEQLPIWIAQLSRLFDAYYTTKPGGNGHGLNNAKNILIDHYESTDVDSRPGHRCEVYHLA